MFEPRLQVLRAQVEPHFLFNTLAHIQRFYEVDPVRGRAMLDSFCGYLRAVLPHMRGESSTVAQEVGLARAYLEIQQLRMRGRLRFAIDVPHELNDATLPPMMLVPLVENAIKHGVAPLPEGGAISISATMEARTLRLRVADTGAGFCRAGKTSGASGCPTPAHALQRCMDPPEASRWRKTTPAASSRSSPFPTSSVV